MVKEIQWNLPKGCKVVGNLMEEPHNSTLTQDVAQVELENGWIIDIGWYPEHDPTGKYFIRVYQYDWNNPVNGLKREPVNGLKRESDNPYLVVGYVEAIAAFISEYNMDRIDPVVLRFISHGFEFKPMTTDIIDEQSVGGHWMVPIWGCDSLDKIADALTYHVNELREITTKLENLPDTSEELRHCVERLKYCLRESKGKKW